MPLQRVPVALSIAGSDSSGGAGIQADLKTFSALGVYGATVLTAVTAQSTRGISAVHIIPPQIVSAQLEAVFDDLDIRAVKLGMLADAATVEAVVAGLIRYRPFFVALDPVMIASSGTRLLSTDAVSRLISGLLPLTDCLTPNLAEAAALLQTTLASSEAEMEQQGRALLDLGPRAVLMKGGHAMLDEAVDLLVTRTGTQRFAAPRIVSSNLHGTGCTLSAGITAAVVRGAPLTTAIEKAKGYLSGAVDAGRDLVFGHGSGPVDHLHRGRYDRSSD
ncbi:MAG: bifunctional hydroxymethylpyrimidine kinase/phosphomethylpyrimidine kinase [Rhodanobacter sp.]|nr:MAG: bifunctional hydroxymethylpyrimidine kinase/phosphomethylpyrimidine kinase [Rhodanobacter sp.]